MAIKKKPKKKKAETAQQLRTKCLKASQMLARLESADDEGYCSCVSCGVTKQWNDGMQGGHFIPKGRSSYWSLAPVNIWPQCVRCNQFEMQHGIADQKYTLWMIDTFGREFVEEMHEKAKDLKKISTAEYRDLLETLNANISFHKKRIGA